MKIVFFGTPYFAVEVLDCLIEAGLSVLAVITKPDQPQGRSLKLVPSPVKKFISEKNLDVPVYQPQNASKELGEVLKALAPDFYVVVGYGEILKESLLSIPKLAPINIHTSLLPNYRGAAPIQRAMMAGEKKIGITVMKMNPKMDAGKMLLQDQIDVDFSETFDLVEGRLIELSKKSILKVLKNYHDYEAAAREQDLAMVSHAPKIDVEDSVINVEDASNLTQRKIMALSPKPGAFIQVKINGDIKRLKILDAVVSNKVFSKGFLTCEEGELILGCSDCALSVRKLQPEGKNVMSYKDFLNGHKVYMPLEILL